MESSNSACTVVDRVASVLHIWAFAINPKFLSYIARRTITYTMATGQWVQRLIGKFIPGTIFLLNI
jgi:hypothetical protein